jgi:AraC-like DNA-binding protein
MYFDVRARAPWIAESPATPRICSNVMPDSEHVIAFHIMLDGWCYAQLADESEPPIRMEAGDAVIFPQGEGHFMGPELGRRSEPNLDMYYRPLDKPLPFVISEFGGTGAPARFVCGYLGCDARPYNPILDALPRMLHVRASSTGGVMTNDLIRIALQEHEEPRAGGETILSKLSELMFLQAVRQYIDSLPPESTGWLSGLRDRHITAALRLMHAKPEENWTLETLAREAGMSRSAFAERFAEVMGVPPMQYLANWRLQRAARLLEQPSISIAQAAAAVGYESEAAFNRAFKKQVGLPPGAWRRSRGPSVEKAAPA